MNLVRVMPSLAANGMSKQFHAADARRRHNNDSSLKESKCLEDSGRPTKNTSICHGYELTLKRLFDPRQR